MNFIYSFAEMMISEQKKKPKFGLGKGGSGLGSRKALNDITNKTNIHQETSTKKNNSSKKEVNFNISEERFLHDHNKCIQAQQTMTESMFWDIVLPGHGKFLVFIHHPFIYKKHQLIKFAGSLPLEEPVSESDLSKVVSNFLSEKRYAHFM